MRALLFVLLLALLAAGILVFLRAGGDAVDARVVEDNLHRERVVAAASISDWPGALEAIRPLIEREDAALEDLVRAGSLHLEESDLDLAREIFTRAAGEAPDDPLVLWGLYRIDYEDGRFEEALPFVQAVHAQHPDDFPTKLALANTYAELDEEEQAGALYGELMEMGLDFGGSWYVSAVYRLSTLHRRRGEEDAADERLAEYNRLREQGITVPNATDMRRGSFGQVATPPPGELEVSDAARLAALGDGGAPTRFEPRDLIPVPGGLTGLTPVRRRDTTLPERSLPGAHAVQPEPVELLAWGPAGLFLARPAAGGWEITPLAAGPVQHAAALNVDPFNAKRRGHERDGLLDVVAVTERGVELFLATLSEEGTLSWAPWPTPLLGPGFEVSDLAPVDFDHEGDVDLLLVGPSGVRLLRNDGVPAPDSTFTDVTAEAGLPLERGFRWCALEDVDIDNDVDFLLGGPGGAFYAKNERGGRFSDASAQLPPDLTSEPALVDLTRDARPDLVARGDGRLRVFANRIEDRFESLADLSGTGDGGNSRPLVSDLGDVDALSALLPAAEGGLVRLALRPAALADAPPADLRPGSIARADVSGDGVDDLVLATSEGFQVLEARSDDRWTRIELQGVKDNRIGLGAIVELRVGPLYQRWYWDGTPRSIALGAADQLDVLRVTWPNGVIQTLTDLPADQAIVVLQREGLVGSCPFLYAWNGTEYAFISDVLGITPLGLPIDHHRLVPPDHDEYVLLRGDQLAPRDGVFELQFTEELREVTYLDAIRLDVVDHPAGVEVQPNERFTFPPFPEPHTHALRTLHAPTVAVDQDGTDWRAELEAEDEVLARGFEPLRGQYLGLASPHHLELHFDPEVFAGAERFRLAMTGWLYWTDASVNVASAGHPSIEFVPPLLEVPDGAGGWTQVGPPLGFPAGKLKTMVVDVTPFVNRADPRLRITSTLALFWDSIRLCTDVEDAPLRVTPIQPEGALLWERGFSEPIPLQGDLQLDWFEWDHVEAQPRWNQHPGMYTRLGETLPLVTAVDDRYVIMGSGDALTVTFPAAGLPPLEEGWERSYLVFLDGWAKDRDPNTQEALYVEPLPFHGMSAYPYPTTESFPDTPEHRAWREEWNTRHARRWIEPLAPADPLGPGAGRSR